MINEPQYKFAIFCENLKILRKVFSKYYNCRTTYLMTHVDASFCIYTLCFMCTVIAVKKGNVNEQQQYVNIFFNLYYSMMSL